MFNFVLAALAASSFAAPHGQHEKHAVLLSAKFPEPDVVHRDTFPPEGVVEDANRRGEAALTPSGDRGRSVKALRARQELSGDEETVDHSLLDENENELSHGELSNIYTIDCLEKRQKDPRAPCRGAGAVGYAEQPGPLNIGSFPSWRDRRRCHSNGQLFCDPDGLLQKNETVARGLTNMLGSFRQTTRVKCGQLESQLQASLSPLHDRPFNLGVAVAYNWPDTETDNDSLQKFGDNLFRQWGMLPFYNGVDAMNGINNPDTRSQAETNCPNAAVLIILPKHGVVYTATPGCQFFCRENGGQPIDEAVLAALEERGLAEAIEVGIQEVAAVVSVANGVPNDMVGYGPRSYWRRGKSIQDNIGHSEAAWTFAMRLLMCIVVFLALVICINGCWLVAGQPLKTKLERTAAAAAQRAETQSP